MFTKRIGLFEQRRMPGRRLRPSLARALARLHPDALITWFPPKRSWVILLKQHDGSFSYWKKIDGRPTLQNTVHVLSEHHNRRWASERRMDEFEAGLDESMAKALERMQAEPMERIVRDADRVAFHLGIGRSYRAQPCRPSGTAPSLRPK